MFFLFAVILCGHSPLFQQLMASLRKGQFRITCQHFGVSLGFIYIKAKANTKATSLLTWCIVSDLCIYTTATAVAANIEEKNRFRVRFRSNINEPLHRH